MKLILQATNPLILLIMSALSFSIAIGEEARGQGVDLITGRAQVSIPLWTISNADLSVPISVWHHGGALRVEEGEGSCGMGWNLSAGGAVYRQVRGLPDDYKQTSDGRRGWLFDGNAGEVDNLTSLPDDNLASCTDESSAFSFIDGRGYTKDTEPDIFSFSAPGLSGQFVFGTDGNPKLLVHQDLKIVVTKDVNDRIAQFAITNNKGITYTFANLENITRKIYKRSALYVSHFRAEYLYYQLPATFTGSWHLSTIVSSASGQMMSFNYASGETAESNRYVITIPSDNVPDTLYYVRDEVNEPKRLSSVTSGGYTANITWLNNLVRRVAVTDAAYGNVRQFDFVYRGFRSSTNTAEPKIHRYFLKEIKQLHNCEPYPDYSFSYQGITFGSSGDILTAVFPWETRDKQDYWGYYNGVSGNKNVPNYFFYSAESGARRLTTYAIAGATLTSSATGFNRDVVPALCGFGALTEINYPQGGQTKFTYESNTYYDASVSATFNGGGVRVSRITTSAGEVAYGKGVFDRPETHTIQKDYEYKLSNDTTSGLLTYPTKYAFVTDSGVFRTPYPLGAASEVLYSRVTEKLRGKGKTVFEYELPNMHPDANGTGSKIARSGGTCVVGDFKNGIYTFPFAAHTNAEMGLLKKRSEYDSSSNLTREERMYYTTLSSGSTINALRFERISNGFHFSKYTISTGAVKAISQEVSKVIADESATDSTRVTTTYSYNANRMLEYITRTNDDGSYTKERLRYVKDYEAIGSPPSTDIPEYALKQLLTANRHGEVVETTKKYAAPGGAEKTVSASLVLYKVYDNGRLLPHRFLSYPPVSTYYFQSDVASSKFRYDSSYMITRTIDEYDGPGNVLAESDNHRNVAGYHRVSGYTAPASASFIGCTDKEAVHENFELSTGRGFIATGGASVTGWTGLNGYQLGTLTSASVTKRGNKYRIACWAIATQARTITFKAKVGSNVVSNSTTLMTYASGMVNKWTYLEGVMDVASAASPFTVEVTADGAISLDDVTALPEAARASFSVYRPLVGLLAETDDRGNSVTYTYDSLGRRVNTFDRKRNLVENRQYVFAVVKAKKLVAGFTTPQVIHRKGQSSTFNATNISCIDGVAYAWAVYRSSPTPVATGTGSSFAHAFASMGLHNVQLTVSHASYGTVTFSEDVCVREPLPSSYSITLSGGGSTVYSCSDMSRTFTVVHPPTSSQTQTVKFSWYMMTATTGTFGLISGAPNTSSITVASPAENYSVKCVIAITYSGLNGLDALCPTAAQPTPAETNTLNLVYQYNGPCN